MCVCEDEWLNTPIHLQRSVLPHTAAAADKLMAPPSSFDYDKNQERKRINQREVERADQRGVASRNLDRCWIGNVNIIMIQGNSCLNVSINADESCASRSFCL